MITYGDHLIRAETKDRIASLENLCRSLSAPHAHRPAAALFDLAQSPAQTRHELATRLLLEGGELVQALADHEFLHRGSDDLEDIEWSCGRILLHLGTIFRESCHRPGSSSTGARVPPGASTCSELIAELAGLQALRLPPELTIKIAEGYAFYGLFPETYLAAAELFRSLHPSAPVQVIGLRSIGTSLAAVVSSAFPGSPDGAAVPITLRPTGHPFHRELRIGPRLRDFLFRRGADTRSATHFLIVDEGPGLSGSSFGSAAKWLEFQGISRQQIHFLPSHEGQPGAEAAPETRERWEHGHKFHIPYEQMVREKDPRLWAHSWLWKSRTLDLSAGKWRSLLFPDPREWPPSLSRQERRKYLVSPAPWTSGTAGLIGTSGTRILARFIGLGAYGGRKLARAQALSDAGITPRFLGFRHGFLLEEWLEASEPVSLCRPADRQALLETLKKYLALIRHLPPGAQTAGSNPLPALFQMARANIEQGLGPTARENFECWQTALPALSAVIRPVQTDNKLHLWEWRKLPDGRVLKCDAIDHHFSHDCIGAQDLHWDLTGAQVELGLTLDELHALSGQTNEDLLRFQRHCYLAFQLGVYTQSSQALKTSDPDEFLRHERMRSRYSELLREECEGMDH